MSGIDNWQIFGIISGVCFIYSLFLPFKIIQNISTIENNVVTHEIIWNLFMDSINYALNGSITEYPIEYAIQYIIMLFIVIGLISIFLLIWTSISGNITFAIFLSITYSILCFIFIFNTINNPNIISVTLGYYMLMCSAISSILIPFIYKYIPDIT